jgi:hypothetical protein
MAKNVRAKIPETDSLVIFDTNAATTKRFVEEVGIAASSTGAPGKGTGIEIARHPREVAEKAVRCSVFSFTQSSKMRTFYR